MSCSRVLPRGISPGLRPERHAEAVLSLADFAFRSSDLRGSGIEQLFGLVDVEPGRSRACLPQRGQTKAVLTGVAVFAGDIEFEIILAQLEVLGSDIGHKGCQDATPGFFAGEKLRPAGFTQTLDATPEI